MRLNIAIPEASVKKPVLDGALEAVTRLNEDLIKSGVSPTSHQLIEQGAIWKPEPPGAEHFDHGAEIAKRGWGDCDDWAPLHAATLRVTGEDPGAMAVVRKSGPKRWHAVVKRSDGAIDDPSLAAGMPGPAQVVGVRGAWIPSMFPRHHDVSGTYIAKPALALRPLQDRFGQPEAWQARADLPWHWGPPGNAPLDVAMASLHASPIPDQAIAGAARGAFRLGVSSGCSSDADLKHLAAIADACEGASWEELAENYGPEHATAAGAVIGSFFGRALKGISRAAKGVARGALKVATPALSLVPGGSLATAAFNAASPALQNAVLKQKHKAPAQRGPQTVRAAAPAPGAPSAQRAPAVPPGFLPYPYPVPYPIPGWGSAPASPGVAWPPR